MKDRPLGVSDGRRHYDLPFHKDTSASFLVLLMALMTFLMLTALTVTLILNAMATRWSSGLEGQITIEIPAENPQGNLREKTDIQTLADQIQEALNKIDGIKHIRIMTEEDIVALVGPWLGEGAALESIPMPGMISLTLDTQTDPVPAMRDAMLKIAPDIRIDTHEEWLYDLLRFTGSLRMIGFLITGMIAIATIITVIAAVKTRIAIFQKDVTLLHLMGASDRYIAGQFQRHALLLAVKGCGIGVVLASAILFLAGHYAGDAGQGLLPDFEMSTADLATLIGAILFLITCAALAARFTVLRVLSQMP